MRKVLLASIVLVAGLGVVAASDSRRGESENRGDRGDRKFLLHFSSMVGVDGAFIGEANAVRNVPGDEAPWEVAHEVHGWLDTNGFLMIMVHGLVFTHDPSVPPELQGRNDETEFRGLVSCLTDQDGAVVVTNLVTPGFPATPTGDSKIMARVDLPSSCVAPIVMVLAGSEDKWFAMTGSEAAGD